MTNDSPQSLKILTRKILEQGYLMSLATVDEAGPWVSDLIFVSDDDLAIYWMSKTETRHSKAIAQNRKVAAAITVSNRKGESNIGLQLEGLASEIKDEDLAIATKYQLKRGKPAPTAEEGVVNVGGSWYRLQPTKIEIIYEPYWGFSKKVIICR